MTVNTTTILTTQNNSKFKHRCMWLSTDGQ